MPSGEKIYAKRRGKKRLGETRDTIMMHRYILSADDEHEVDHINGNSLDNRRCNLRIVTRSENMANRAIFRNNTSGYKGVFRIGDKYKFRITAQYDTAEEAVS